MHRLSALDLSLVAIYLAGITLFGLQFRSKDRSLLHYFLADRRIPWWAIALSIVAAETSTLTIISVPGLAYTGDWGFLQIVLGYLLGRIVVCIMFLPRYFRGELLTAYEVIGERFGPRLHKLTAFLFLFLRAAAEGVRVFAVSIVVGIAIGTRDIVSIAIICTLTLIYTLEGGMAAVIWTDVVQMALYVAGTIVSVILLGHRIPGGWPAIHTVAAAAGKLTPDGYVIEAMLPWSNLGIQPQKDMVIGLQLWASHGETKDPKKDLVEQWFPFGMRFDPTLATYHVRLSDNPQHCSCECRGFVEHTHCKHVEGLLALVKRGKLVLRQKFHACNHCCDCIESPGLCRRCQELDAEYEAIHQAQEMEAAGDMFVVKAVQAVAPATQEQGPLECRFKTRHRTGGHIPNQSAIFSVGRAENPVATG